MDTALGLVVSPTAGNGRGVAVGAQVARRLDAAGYRVIPLAAPTVAETHMLLDRAIHEIDGIVTVGGDGTIHLALQHVVGTRVFLGHVPFGTGNDIARDLGLTTRWETGLEHLLDSLASREPDDLDVMEITGSHGTEWGMAIVSAGFDADVNLAANTYRRPHGHARYLRAILATLPRFTPRTYRIEASGRTNTAQAIVVAVANLSSFGGGLALSPGSDGGDGRLELIVARPLRITELARIFPRLYRGTHLDAEMVHVRTVTEVTLDAEGATAMVDGEEVGPLPVTVRVRSRAVRFLR